MINFKSILTNTTPIEETAWNDFEGYFSEKVIRKNEVLWKAGAICKHLVFINSGLIRAFQNTDDRRVTTNFYLEGSIFYDDYSFISQQPCTCCYEALEDTFITLVPRAAVYLMFDNYKSFERLGRMMVERNHVLLMEEQQNNKSLSAMDKYLRLLREKPTLVQRVPLKFIASYLDMTPEYLSKLRKDLTDLKT
jgi:CRP-like cAMP-binding protein